MDKYKLHMGAQGFPFCSGNWNEDGDILKDKYRHICKSFVWTFWNEQVVFKSCGACKIINLPTAEIQSKTQIYTNDEALASTVVLQWGEERWWAERNPQIKKSFEPNNIQKSPACFLSQARQNNLLPYQGRIWSKSTFVHAHHLAAAKRYNMIIYVWLHSQINACIWSNMQCNNFQM